MIPRPRGLTDWLFITGLILPSAYMAISPGIYLTTWYQILASATSSGITMVILFAGLLKAIMYVSGQAGRTKGKFSRRIGDAFFGFHVVVDVSVLLAMFWVGIIQGQREAAVGAFYALFATEFMVFPIIGVSFLQDSIRHRRQNLTSVLLASFAIYLCMAVLTVSNFITDQSVQNISQLSPLEAAGAKVFSVLIFLISLARAPLFWLTSSLYSVDLAAPPFWVSGIYVLTVAFYLFYDAQRERDWDAKVSALTSYAHVPLDVVRTSKTVLAATILAFGLVSVSDFLLPHNVSGDVLQLFIVSVILLMSFGFMGRKAREP